MIEQKLTQSVTTSFKFSSAYSKESWMETSTMVFDKEVTNSTVIRAFKLVMQAQNTIDALIIPTRLSLLEAHEIEDYITSIEALINQSITIFKTANEDESVEIDSTDKLNYTLNLKTVKESLVILKDIFKP